MPVFRLKQEEEKILKTFHFGTEMFPCVEIFKEFSSQTKTAKARSFAQTYVPVIESIKASNVFVDLPVHVKVERGMKTEVLEFLNRVVGSRQNRTAYILQLSSLARKIIPIISTYSQRTGELGSIIAQEYELRKVFSRLAFRTFPETLDSDLEQISKIAQSQDYLIVDIGERVADPDEEFVIQPIIESLTLFSNCQIVILSSAIPNKVTNRGLAHTLKIEIADNRLLKTFRDLKGNCFGDYVGIKKDKMTDGGAISPGFILFDAVRNEYYGFRGSDQPSLDDLENIIVPAVLESDAAVRMNAHNLPFLNVDNLGWSTILAIRHGIEPGKSQGKFKGISMKHYLHCVNLMIGARHFNL